MHTYIHRPTDRQTDRQTGRQAGRQTGIQTDRQTDRHTDRQTGRQADRQTGRQADRQTDRHTWITYCMYCIMPPQTLWKHQEKPPHLDFVDFRSKSPTALSPTKRHSESKGAISCWNVRIQNLWCLKRRLFRSVEDWSWGKHMELDVWDTPNFKAFWILRRIQCKDSSHLCRSWLKTAHRLPEAKNSVITTWSEFSWLPIQASWRCRFSTLLVFLLQAALPSCCFKKACWREGLNLVYGFFDDVINDFKKTKENCEIPLFAKGSEHFPHTLLQEGPV